VLKHAVELDAALAPMLDREVEALSPIEHGVLLLGGYELIHQPDVPYRVVLNEAVDLAKRYGGTDGHKYINGVLDKLAQVVRQVEVGAGRSAR
jgi:N utilization substance protein B